MPITDILKEVNLLFLRKQSRSDGMYRRITLVGLNETRQSTTPDARNASFAHPSLVVETARFVQVFEKLHVCL